MTEKVETLHAAGFLISEANGNRSRENITLASGENRGAGTVLGATVTAGTVTGAAGAGNTGNATIGTLSAGGGAIEGVYTAVCETATTFIVLDPVGREIGKGAFGSAFTGDVVFTITAGGTPCVATDAFNITVSQLTRKYKILAPAATDGTQRAAAVLLAPTDATSADTACAAIVRSAELNKNEVVWPGGITAAQQDVATAQLRAAAVVLR